jgi:POT family proton-dependent oligopeptide transporter
MDGLQPSTTIAIAEFGDAGKHYGIRDEKTAEDVSEKYELDGIHDGLIFPTEEERATLRRVPDAIPWSAYRTSQFYSFHVIFLNRTYSHRGY